MGQYEVESCLFRCAVEENEKELPGRDVNIAVAVNGQSCWRRWAGGYRSLMYSNVWLTFNSQKWAITSPGEVQDCEPVTCQVHACTHTAIKSTRWWLKNVSMAQNEIKSTKPTYWRKDIVHRQDGWPREHCRHVDCTHRRAENRKRLRMQAEG